MAFTFWQREMGEYIVPVDAQLECKINVVVYDGKTDSLDSDGKTWLNFNRSWSCDQ